MTATKGNPIRWLTLSVEGILLGLLVLPLCVWAAISPRTLRRWLPHDPDAEPGNAAYLTIRLVALIPIAALGAIAVLVYGAGNRDRHLVAGYASAHEVSPVPVMGYRQGASDREIGVMVRTGSAPCDVEVSLIGESLSEVEIDARLLSPASPWSTPCASGSTTTLVWVVLDHPLAERAVVTRAPRRGSNDKDPWEGPLHIVPRWG